MFVIVESGFFKEGSETTKAEELTFITAKTVMNVAASFRFECRTTVRAGTREA